MILSNAQAHQEIQRLQRALAYVTLERDEAAAQSAQWRTRAKELERQIAERDKTIQKIYRECFL